MGPRMPNSATEGQVLRPETELRAIMSATGGLSGRVAWVLAAAVVSLGLAFVADDRLLQATLAVVGLSLIGLTLAVRGLSLIHI